MRYPVGAESRTEGSVLTEAGRQMACRLFPGRDRVRVVERWCGININLCWEYASQSGVFGPLLPYLAFQTPFVRDLCP